LKVLTIGAGGSRDLSGKDSRRSVTLVVSSVLARPRAQFRRIRRGVDFPPGLPCYRRRVGGDALGRCLCGAPAIDRRHPFFRRRIMLKTIVNLALALFPLVTLITVVATTA